MFHMNVYKNVIDSAKSHDHMGFDIYTKSSKKPVEEHGEKEKVLLLKAPSSFLLLG